MELIEIIIGKNDGQSDARVGGQHEPGANGVDFAKIGRVLGSRIDFVETFAHGRLFLEEFVACYGVEVGVHGGFVNAHPENLANTLTVREVVVVLHN